MPLSATFKSLAILLLSATLTTAGPIHQRTIGGTRICTGANFAGDCWYGVLPLNTCISLNSFAHNTLSFRPDDSTECFVMQGRCNSEMPYADLYSYSTDAGNLGDYSWISAVQSFICFQSTTPHAERMMIVQGS